jgi:hypothetical protein
MKATQLLVRVRDHEPNALQASLHELAQERGPELVVLARPGGCSKDRALASRRDPDRHGGPRSRRTGYSEMACRRRPRPRRARGAPPLTRPACADTSRR